MLSEVSQRDVDKRRRRSRHEHLTAVPGRSDAGCAVNVVPHVALGREKWCACVNSDTDANRPVRRKLLRELYGRTERAGCRGEREEERITLGIDLGAAVPPTRFADDTPMP